LSHIDENTHKTLGYINVLILTLFLTALEEPSWNLYNALNFFLISMTTGDADKVSIRHGTCQLLLTIFVIDWRDWDGF
jgi:hypothetical protein